MENQPTSDPKVITAYNLKQALFSVAIGAAVSLITIAAQALIHWLQHLPPMLPGAALSMTTYWKSWKYNHLA